MYSVQLGLKRPGWRQYWAACVCLLPRLKAACVALWRLSVTLCVAALGAHCCLRVCVGAGTVYPGTTRFFPPSLNVLLAWSLLFRSGGTLRNYFAFVKTGCLVCGVSTEVFDHPALIKARATCDKLGGFKKRAPLWLQRAHVEMLVLQSKTRPELHAYAMLFLLAYAFLLRVPSEAIPVMAGSGECCLELEGSQLVLCLKRRKNRPGGSRLVRSCWCSESASTCPVHMLGPMLASTEKGKPLFPGISAWEALRTLRKMLSDIGLPKAEQYRLHDFRRGHAKDLQLSGSRACLGL